MVHLVDVGRDDAGPFLVMELVRGIQAYDLVTWARDHRALLDVQLVLRLVIDVANGLHAAHELVSDAGERGSGGPVARSSSKSSRPSWTTC